MHLTPRRSVWFQPCLFWLSLIIKGRVIRGCMGRMLGYQSFVMTGVLLRHRWARAAHNPADSIILTRPQGDAQGLPGRKSAAGSAGY